MLRLPINSISFYFVPFHKKKMLPHENVGTYMCTYCPHCTTLDLKIADVIKYKNVHGYYDLLVWLLSISFTVSMALWLRMFV